MLIIGCDFHSCFSANCDSGYGCRHLFWHQFGSNWGRTPPLSCSRPQPYQKRTKYRQIYRYFPLLTRSNLFGTNSRWVGG